MASVVSSALLCSASIPAAAATQSPLSTITAKHHPQLPDHHLSLCFYRFWEQSHPSNTRTYICRITRGDTGLVAGRHNVLFICSALSFTRDEFISQRKIGGRGGCTNWNATQERWEKKRAYRRNIRLIHRRFQRDFGAGSRRYFSTLCECFFFALRENSGGIPRPCRFRSCCRRRAYRWWRWRPESSSQQ